MTAILVLAFVPGPAFMRGLLRPAPCDTTLWRKDRAALLPGVAATAAVPFAAARGAIRPLVLVLAPLRSIRTA